MTQRRVLLLLILVASALSQQPDLKLLPRPRTIAARKGSFDSAGPITIAGAAKATKTNKAGIEMLREEMVHASGKKTAVAGAKSIRLEILAKTKYPELSSADAELFAGEGYVLDITPRRITISGATDAGVFYGLQTLRQLIHPGAKGKGFTVPAVHIVDWPAIRWRGVHDDISRGPIPTMEYMKTQIRTLAEYKINMFSLYMEHVFAYKFAPVAAPQEAAITADDVRELVKYAAQYHVTLLPEQQAFGHLHHVLKYEQFSDLAETPHGHVLAPVNDKSYDFIRNMYSELIPLFPGPLFHIGADETFELGTGATKQRAAEVGLGKVYLEHVAKVDAIVKPYGKRLLFWGDIALHYPELLNILPKDAIAVSWDYDPEPSFDKSLQPFANAGLNLMVAPGANNWNRIVPDYHAANINVRNFIRDGQKFHALGALNTTWDDDGEALFEMTWPPLIFGAAASWQSGESSTEEFQRSYDWAFYRNDEDDSFSNAVEQLARTHDILKQNQRGGGAMDDGFWNDPFSEVGWRYNQRNLPVARDLRLAAEGALDLIYKNRAKAKLHVSTIDALEFGALRLDALGMKLHFADEISRIYREAYETSVTLANQPRPVNPNPGTTDPQQPPAQNLPPPDPNTPQRRISRGLSEITGTNARLEDLRDSVERLKELYRERWLAENKPYWLGSVLVRYDALALRYQKMIADVRTARAEYNRTKLLPKPETLGLAPIPKVEPAPVPRSE
jgi:hexosaminidase